MSSRNVTAAKTLEAIHTLTSLAVPEPEPVKPSPFEYGSGTDQFRMTDFNAPPMLIVWLFLVTNPSYLQQLETGTGTFDGKNIASEAEIAGATNLTPGAVKSVLDVYRAHLNCPLTGGATVNNVQGLFHNVADQFSKFAMQQAMYPRPHCLGRGDALLQLAQGGSLVDPAATSFPSFPA